MGRGFAPWIAVMLITALTPTSMAQDIPTMLKHNGCLACHHDTRMMVGPSFKAMADRHRAEPQAALTRFTAKLRTGSGHPIAALDDASIGRLTDWILKH